VQWATCPQDTREIFDCEITHFKGLHSVRCDSSASGTNCSRIHRVGDLAAIDRAFSRSPLLPQILNLASSDWTNTARPARGLDSNRPLAESSDLNPAGREPCPNCGSTG
jgi:hypothetical protein